MQGEILIAAKSEKWREKHIKQMGIRGEWRNMQRNCKKSGKNWWQFGATTQINGNKRCAVSESDGAISKNGLQFFLEDYIMSASKQRSNCIYWLCNEKRKELGECSWFLRNS